ncbi:MAG: hypothetical protein EOS50_33065, partial [Mesorhizobium sp.]
MRVSARPNGIAPVPLRSAGGNGACCTVSESGVPIAAVAQHGRGARGALRQAYASDRPQHRGASSGRSRAAVRRSMRQTATGLRRRARRRPDPGSPQPSAEGTSHVNALSEQILSELRHLL